MSDVDVLLMDRGYPSRWLVAALNARGIGFRMRVENAGNTGFACVRDFLRSDEHERIVTLAAPGRRDADDYECPAKAQTVRLVRHVASTGNVRVLMTHLLDPTAFPCTEFGDLYHRRWRIEEAFKHLKPSAQPRTRLRAVDFAAKIVCDNLQSLATETALRETSLPPTRRINRAVAHSFPKPLLPALLLGADIAKRLLDALQLIAGRTYSHGPGVIKSKPRLARPKPHKSMSQKPC